MRFGAPEWWRAVVAGLQAHPDLPAALAGLGRDGALVIEADPPVWPRPVAVWAEQRAGRIARWRILEDEDEILELAPAYVVRAPYRTLRGLIQGGDPVQAALTGRVRIEGDLEALLRRTRYRHVIEDVLAAVPTELP
ncbi:MAG TPA: hypothetical protein VEB43_04505 [Anaeromyxobacter sp.]|nr:hypothetical protein [Anaeromyxobacter sp.]